ncbi:MAG: response regulator [Candidatus Dormibacter sp.]
MTQRILVVDDDSRLLRVVGMYLAMEGYEVTDALDGVAGLQEAEQDPPDLIIMDIMMPGMDGIRACTLLRSNPKTAHIPVVLFSALSGSDDVERARQSGANHLITKPFNLVGLAAVVRDLCASEAAIAS